MGGEWKEVSVSELAAPGENALATGPFGSAISSRYFQSYGVPVIRGSNLTDTVGERLVEKDLVFLSPEKAKEFKRSIVRRGDLVFTCWGTIGQVGLIDERAKYDSYVVSNKQMKLTPDPSIADSLFLYYSFSGPATLAQIRNQAIGSSVPGFNLGQLKGIRLRLPPLSEQRVIAHILGTLDDKIELNRRMNETLEAMARALFQSWFVDFGPVQAKAEGRQPFGMDPATVALFPSELQDSELGPIPKGWRHVPVREVCEGLFDGPHATPPEADSGAVFLGIKNFRPTSLDLTSVRYISEDDWPRWTQRVEPRHEDIVFTYEATLGFFALIPPDLRCCLGRRTALVRPRRDARDSHYLFHWFIARPFQEFLRAHRQPGSTVDRIWLKDFPGYPVLQPPKQLVHLFEEQVCLLWSRIHANQSETATLARLRDTLLPRLLSGELSVGKAMKSVEAMT